MDKENDKRFGLNTQYLIFFLQLVKTKQMMLGIKGVLVFSVKYF